MVFARTLDVGDRIANARISHFLDRGDQETDLPGRKNRHVRHLGAENTDAINVIVCVSAHHADPVALLELTIDDAHDDDNAQIDIIIAIDQQSLQRSLFIAHRCRKGASRSLPEFP